MTKYLSLIRSIFISGSLPIDS